MSNKICVIGFGTTMLFIFSIVEYADKLMGFFSSSFLEIHEAEIGTFLRCQKGARDQ